MSLSPSASFCLLYCAATAAIDGRLRGPGAIVRARSILQEPEMTRHRDFASSAERVTVHRGNDRLREPFDPAQHLVAEADEALHVRARERGAEVGAGTKDPVSAPGHDEGPDRVV